MGSIRMSDTPKIPVLRGGIPMPHTWGIPGAIWAPIAFFLIQFPGFLEVMSTAKKITILKGYFFKTADLIAIWACSLAGFYGHLFLTHISGGFSVDSVCKCPWLPAIAITSENFGFSGGPGFRAVRGILFYGWVRVRIFQKYFRK